MKLVLKLTFAFARERIMRVVLTSLATIAAACMVVWVVSGYDALLNSFENFSDKALGRYPLAIAPISHFRQYAPGAIPTHAEKYVPPALVEALRADPAVVAADPMWAAWATLRTGDADASASQPTSEPTSRPSAGPSAGTERPGRGSGRPGGRPRGASGARPGPVATPGPRIPTVILLGTDATEAPFPLAEGRWIDPARPDALEVAVSADIARRLRVGVGGELLAGHGEDALHLRVVGLVSTPSMGPGGFAAYVAGGQLRSPSIGGVYAPMALAERIQGRPSQISFVGVVIKPDVDVTQFRFGWATRLSAFDTPCQFQDSHDIEETLDQSASAENMRMQAYAATGISLLAALFIIFSTLNIGVTERTRQLAILRAVVLTRAQVAQLILIESLLLATIGFLGGIGAGQVVLTFATQTTSGPLTGGAVMGVNSVLLAAACAYGGALLAALVPAFRATRVRPIDAMAPQSPTTARHVPVAAVVVGLLLIVVNPIITFAIPHADDAPFVLYMLLGGAAMAVGFILLAPAAVVLVDRLISPVLARVLALEPTLLGSQISSNLWRTVSTSVALTIGLGLYVAIQVWGFTMLAPFIPGAWAPDALITFQPDGLPPERVASVAQFPGVDGGRCLPIVAEQPRLLEDLTNSAERASVTRQDNVVIVGLDPERAFGGDTPLLTLDWQKGSAAEAIPLLKTGRGCIVPDHFLREAKLKVGDSFMLVPPENHEHPVQYTIAGAVRLPGWHWQTKPTGFRTRTHRAAALVFADYATVAGDFGFKAASHVWLDLDPAKTDAEKLGAAAQALYGEVVGRDVAIGGALGDAPYVRVMPVEGIRGMVRAHAKRWIWAMSQLPLVTLVVTSIAVLNAILASVRARRWDMGILRALGFTRWTLVRLVIAEGLLVGAVACVLSLGFGIVAGWCGAGMSQYLSFFGGLHPPLVVPWLRVLAGLGGVLALSALAAVWPAVTTGRTHPLTLLQQGRATF
ncbi:MAG: ABC transporter permease [Phycisphaerae bacterium]|jgi:putative ABC transport system permease protein